MHRPGIASVVGDKIVLSRTTIQEIKQYHKETLKLCVQLANEEEAKILEQQHLKEEAARKQREAFKKDIEDQARDISFDED